MIGRVIDALLALPLVIVALLALAAVGASNGTVILVIGLTFTPITARTVRSAVFAERHLDYVLAAQLRGENAFYIMFAEILPNVLQPIIVEATVRLGYAIFAVATLSFLGFGIQPPSADWGLALSESYTLMAGGAWWTVVFDAAAIASLVVGVNLVADGDPGSARPMNGPPPSAFPAFDVSKRDRADALTLVGLTVTYRMRGREREVLQDITLRVRRGEAYGLVGESGCGKSTAALAVLRYLPRNGRVKAGKISIGGRDVASMHADALRDLRANAVSMVYQDPGRALNPSLTIARQVSEAFEASGASAADALARTIDMLRRVRIASPERVMDSYPHQLSGGMQQRVVIAMALACNPELLILDEPTTGLDATVEAEVLDLIAQLREELGTAVLFISHNLAVIGRMCDRVGVLYAGKLVEEGATRDVFARPRHPYTVGLLRCLPTTGRSKDTGRLDTIPGFAAAARAR